MTSNKIPKSWDCIFYLANLSLDCKISAKTGVSKIGKRVFVGYGRGISLILWLCVVSYANAQLLTIESEATITIEDNALLHSEGIVENFGTLNNNGTLSLSQDFVNLRSYNPGTGTITLLGDNQTINLINDIQIQGIIYNLTVEGEGSHVLPGYIQVDNRLTLNSGILTVTGEDTLYLGPDAEISGGSENSFVEGHLIYAGNGYRFFPVGKDGVYNPIELLDVQGVNTTLLVVKTVSPQNSFAYCFHNSRSNIASPPLFLCSLAMLLNGSLKTITYLNLLYEDVSFLIAEEKTKILNPPILKFS